MEDGEIKRGCRRGCENRRRSGRLLIRPSDRAASRVMLEGQDVAHITQLAEGLADILTKRFG